MENSIPWLMTVGSILIDSPSSLFKWEKLSLDSPVSRCRTRLEKSLDPILKKMEVSVTHPQVELRIWTGRGSESQQGAPLLVVGAAFCLFVVVFLRHPQLLCALQRGGSFMF